MRTSALSSESESVLVQLITQVRIIQKEYDKLKNHLKTLSEEKTYLIKLHKEEKSFLNTKIKRLENEVRILKLNKAEPEEYRFLVD